jgi:hypothetical protein
VKRSGRLDLSHVLDDSRPTPAIPILEKRIHTRFDKAFLVMIGSEVFGDTFAIARNVSAGGILVEMSYAPPLGAIVTVHFQYERDELVARAEVKQRRRPPLRRFSRRRYADRSRANSLTASRVC